MSNGGGQFTVLQALNADGSVAASAKLYHYAAGTTTLKNIYSDEDLQTTLAQPFVSDSAGRFVFYALGDYKFRIDTSADVTLNTWDNVHISKGQPLISDYGTAYPSAAAANKGHLFAKIDSNNILRGVAVNQNTSFVEIYSANASGTPTTTSLVPKNHPWYDITHTDWGAVAGEASDQSSNIQAAIDAIEAVGYGTLFIPVGTFQVDSILDINNTSINIVGMGIGQSILVQTANAGGAMIDYDATDPLDTFSISGVSLRTSFAGAGNAIDCNWASATGTDDEFTNCRIQDVEISPTNAASATAYFVRGIVLDDANNAHIDNALIKGRDGTRSATYSVSLAGECLRTTINGLKCVSVATAINVAGTCEQTLITNSKLEQTTTGVNFNFAAAEYLNSVTNCHIEAYTTGISLANSNESILSNNTIYKHASSTNNFTGIALGTDSDDCKISDNILINKASTGTEDGIVITQGDRTTITGNYVKSMDTAGIEIASDPSDCTIVGNHIESCGTGILDDSNDSLIEGNKVENCTTGIQTDTNSNNIYVISNRSVNNTTDYVDNGTGTYFRAPGYDEILGAQTLTVASNTLTLPISGDVFFVGGTNDVNTITTTNAWDGRLIWIRGAATANFSMKHAVDNVSNLGSVDKAITQNDTISYIYSSSAWIQATALAVW